MTSEVRALTSRVPYLLPILNPWFEQRTHTLTPNSVSFQYLRIRSELRLRSNHWRARFFDAGSVLPFPRIQLMSIINSPIPEQSYLKQDNLDT